MPLDAGADPVLVADWIAETQAEGQRAIARSRAITRRPSAASQPSADDIAAILDELGDPVTALGEAEPEHKLDLYRGLGLRLTYKPETQTVCAEIDLGEHRWDLVRVRGPTQTRNTRSNSATRSWSAKATAGTTG